MNDSFWPKRIFIEQPVGGITTARVHDAQVEYIRADLAVLPADKRDAEDAARYRYLKANMTFYNTDESEKPVLAEVSRRIWYHATDDLSYPLDAAIDAAMSAGGGGHE